MAIDHPVRACYARKRGRPVGSQSVKNKFEQNMALLDSSSSETDKDDDFVPIGHELAIVPAPQQVTVHYGDTDHATKDVIPVEDEELAIVVADVDAVPIEIVRPRRNKQRKRLSVRQTHEAQHISTSIHTANGNKVLKSNSSVHGNRGSAMDRATKLRDKLPSAYPSFLKLMRPSHCEHFFWLGIPADFYQNHLPKLKTEFMLEDEDGRIHETIYIGDRKGPGLSGGWGHFALFHNIKVDDVVIFQLKESKKFKVYIVREKTLDAIDGAFSQQNLEVPKKRKSSKVGASYDVNSNKDMKATTFDHNVPQSEDSSVISEDPTDGISFSNSGTDFDGMPSFSNFSIVVDNPVDCEFEEHQRRAYYELCCSQKSYLHKNLLRHLNPKLIVGVIEDTISIAERIRACAEEASSREDFMIWKKTLESFELLGMNVSFMVKRVNGLLGLPALSKDLPKYEKYKDLNLEQAHSREKLKALELELSTVKDSLRKIDADLGEMKSSAKKRDLTLQELATAPW